MTTTAEFSEDGQLQATWPMRAGATFIKKYTWATGGVPASPGVPAVPAVPVDLTGWVARVDIRAKITDADILLQLTTENGAITLDNVGNISITVAATQTATLNNLKIAYFDLELQSPTGFVRNLVGGLVTIGANVTRSA